MCIRDRFNNRDHSNFSKSPEHIVLPSEFTGIEAKIIVNIGRLFPLITAHKVLAAYGCLLPRILNGTFDYENHKAVWPSTGNYCRGGVAISRILGLKSVAILPEGMSKERFAWLEKWVENKNDIIKTTGTESNVKEIYDACNELAKDPNNEIINQFSEYYNYAIHRAVTGPSLERSFNKVKGDSNLKARFYVSASGSSGTLAAGDYLKDAIWIGDIAYYGVPASHGVAFCRTDFSGAQINLTSSVSETCFPDYNSGQFQYDHGFGAAYSWNNELYIVAYRPTLLNSPTHFSFWSYAPGNVTLSTPPPISWETDPALPVGIRISNGIISGTCL